MQLEKWAHLAEIVSGAAIVITLILLVFEVRQNTSAILASSYDRLLSDHIQYRMDLATSTETLDAYLTANDREPLANDELRAERGRMTWISGVMLWERAYFAQRYGNLGESEWQRYRSNMCDSDVDAAIGDLEFFVSAEFWQFLQDCRQGR